MKKRQERREIPSRLATLIAEMSPEIIFYFTERDFAVVDSET